MTDDRAKLIEEIEVLFAHGANKLSAPPTPGEWFVDDDGPDFTISTTAGTTICRVLNADDYPCVEEGTEYHVDDEARTNAAVIAKLYNAWPTLRAALSQPARELELHPNWKGADKDGRHPASAKEWDYRNDPIGGALERSIQRLNVAADYDDPRAPDQMALVLRIDLIRLKHDWMHKNAAWESWRHNTPPGPAAPPSNAAREAAPEEALQQIETWSRAYPLKVFPEPDFEKARQLLAAGGMTLDAISASNMRHVVEGVGKIASDALALAMTARSDRDAEASREAGPASKSPPTRSDGG